MRLKTLCRNACLFALAGLLPALSAQAANLIPGAQFNAATDLAGWTASSPAPAVTIAFDKADSTGLSSSGSLALTRGAGNANAIITASRCIATAGGIGASARLSGKVQGSGGVITLAAYAGAVCGGQPLGTWSTQPSSGNTWQAQSLSATSVQANQIGSLAVVLESQTAAVGTPIRFDDLYLGLQMPATSPIGTPALSGAGLALMALVLLFVAGIGLRGRLKV